jgi:hypothetical protein
MATPKQISERIDALFAEWSGGFTPLFFAVLDMKRLMDIRIFGIGTSGGSNTAGQKLPTKPYTPAYALIKQKNGRPPLELTGFLRRSFGKDKDSVFNQGFGSAIFIAADEAGKAEGLQYGNGKGFKGYGPIFQPTDEEQNKMLELHAELLAEQIANNLSKP